MVFIHYYSSNYHKKNYIVTWLIKFRINRLCNPYQLLTYLILLIGVITKLDLDVFRSIASTCKTGYVEDFVKFPSLFHLLIAIAPLWSDIHRLG